MHAIELINQYTLDSSLDRLQLAYVLTPAGRQAAFHQLGDLLGSEAPNRQPFSLEMVDFEGQLADHDVEDEAQQINDDEADGWLESPPDEDLERDPPLTENVIETLILEIPAAASPCNYLPHRARAGLEQILRQFAFEDDEKTRIQTAFLQFITSPESRVGVRVGFDPTRYLWLSAQIERTEYSLLAEIALRLEPANCSEAPSERAIGQQRRYLAPHRTRTKPDLLLARTEMEDYQHSSEQSQEYPHKDLPKR
jgi:hypothetical protein